MWLVAGAIPAAGASLLYHREKLLILAVGVDVMDLAAAIVVSMMWFVARHYIQPLNNNRAENEYSYRAGYRDATLRYLEPRNGLHIVRPATTTAPRIPRRGYATAGPEGRDVS
jgi:hypothetical protein